MSTAAGKRGIRVAIVIPTHWDYRMGGSQYQAKLLIEELHRSFDADITYFTARASENLQFDDHRVVSVGKTNSLRRFGHFWDYFRLQRALHEFAPDVIYQRVGCAYTGISARYARRSGVPMIWHLASEADCRKAPPLSRLLARPHALIESRLAKRGVTHADVVVAQSSDQTEMLHSNFGRRPDRLIRNFQPLPPEVAKDPDRFTVVWIGNFKPVKRPELFIELAGQFAQQSDVEFIMVGRPYPSESVQGRLNKAIRANRNLDHLGGVPQGDVNELLESAHLLVNTSQSEGFSNTFIQAWMRSVPVFTLGVNPDGLLDGGALGSSFEDTAQMASSIRELRSNFDMLNDMGKRSRVHAVQHHSMKNAAELADLIIRTATE
jgi:glycosyltransferase involved in cell wall biosynthesis